LTRHCFLIALAALFGAAATQAFAIDDSPEGEAARLYSRANDYVRNIPEKDYSYAYIQFYWKRAEANLERVERVYPQTSTGQQLQSADAKVGPFALDYFKDRVLPRLEEKRLASFDAVNCAIFLYNLDEQRWDQTRLDAQQSILEVLARQKRWSEALAFPVRDQDRPRKISTIFKVAARYNQKKVVENLLTNATPEEQKLLWPDLGEAMALNGTPREEIAKLLDKHDGDDVKLAILAAMAHREIGIQRAATTKKDFKDGIQETHDSLTNLKVRDDVDSVARQFFPHGNAEAATILASYHAALGQKPASDAPGAVHAAYLDYLSSVARADSLTAYAKVLQLSGDDERKVELKLIELYAANHRDEEAQALLATLDPSAADAGAAAEAEGRMESEENTLTIRENTFSSLPIKDPCVLAQVIMTWSLTPNRSIRGAAPWDSVVYKFEPGFENLPLPKSKDVQNAASATNPY
jgi:hypothetical protein